MAKPASQHTYADVYAFFRERREAGPDPFGRLSKGEQLSLGRRPTRGREAHWWVFGPDDRPRIRRGYGTECGFTVYNPEAVFHGGYSHVAPSNTVSFASTGGGGCHFSFLVSQSGEWSADRPVVMIVPGGTGGYARDEANVVVGANLWEFLGLGLRTGYFVLEMLPCRLERFLEEYPEHIPEGDDPESVELRELAQRFGLVSWERDAICPRLDELREQFFPQLVFPPQEC
jgi:hypothetical protein